MKEKSKQMEKKSHYKIFYSPTQIPTALDEGQIQEKNPREIQERCKHKSNDQQQNKIES